MNLKPTKLNQDWSCYEVAGITLNSDFPFTYPLIRSSNPPALLFTCSHEPPMDIDWLAISPVLQHDYTSAKGAISFQLYSLSDCLVARVSSVGDFYIWPSKIICCPNEPIDACTIELYLLGRIVSIWQETQNQVVLHASAVVVDQHAIAFSTHSGGGKSGLAAAFLADGHALLTDDTLALQIEGQAGAEQNVVLGQPGFPLMRMWPEQAEYFLGEYEHLPRVVPNIIKRRVSVGANGFGIFCEHPVPLAALYILERRSPEQYGEDIEILPLSKNQALFNLITHSFAANVMNRLVDQQQRLKRLLPVVQQVPVYHLLYPSGFEHLATVRKAVLSSVRNQQQ